jgi:hypothetical protein
MISTIIHRRWARESAGFIVDEETADTNTTMTRAMLVALWMLQNCSLESLKHRPHAMTFTTEPRSSFRIATWDACLATSIPVAAIEKLTFAAFRAK